MELLPIGIIHSPFRTQEEAPRQGAYTEKASTIEVFEQFVPALRGLDSYTYIIVLYWADRAARDVLKSRRHQRLGSARGISPSLFIPRAEDRGVFASRSPARPNPICLSVCEITEIEGSTVRVRGLEALDGSPLLDIKPHVPELDCPG